MEPRTALDMAAGESAEEVYAVLAAGRHTSSVEPLRMGREQVSRMDLAQLVHMELAVDVAEPEAGRTVQGQDTIGFAGVDTQPPAVDIRCAARLQFDRSVSTSRQSDRQNRLTRRSLPTVSRDRIRGTLI